MNSNMRAGNASIKQPVAGNCSQCCSLCTTLNRPSIKWKVLCFLIILVLLMLAFHLQFAEFYFKIQVHIFSSPSDYGGETTHKFINGTLLTYTTPSGDANWATVAIGMGITFRGSKGANLNQIPLMKTLVPSFCDTASIGYIYHYYIAYDFNDPYLEKAGNCDELRQVLLNHLRAKCPHIRTDAHLIKVGYSGKPAWAQNDAMMEAYVDGIQYFYRINDDTVMKSKNWTEAFIKQLSIYSPSNVGVTGPNHSGGNTAILTYDFTHQTHIEVFGFYYPRLMTDWYADRWITDVYKPGRSTKLTDIQLVHTMAPGTRYHVNPNVGSKVGQKVVQDKEILNRYVSYVESKKNHLVDGKKVISLSLYGADISCTFGAIRNAQLTPVILPGWTLRIYMENPLEKTIHPAVPTRIIDKLQSLGVQIIYVNGTTRNLPPALWRLFVGDDLTVEYFIVRDCESRLTTRGYKAVSDWMKTDKAFHCVRDHPNHAHHVVATGLFGGKPKEIRKIFSQSWQSILSHIHTNESVIDVFWNETILPHMNKHAYCHDSISCGPKKFENSHPFPVERIGTEHVGQKFDAYGEPKQQDIDVLLKSTKCTDVS